MSQETLFFVQSFKAGMRGKLMAEPLIKCRSDDHARLRAEALARAKGRVGALAFSVTGDPKTDDFGEPRTLAAHGRGPEEALN
jgi:hypothetical protein